MFLLKLDQYCLQLETKEELHIITTLLYVVTGYNTQEQLAQVLNVRQSFISDAKRCSCIPVDWIHRALEKVILGEVTISNKAYEIEYTKKDWFVSPGKENVIYHYPLETVEPKVKIFCEIYSDNKADAVLISYAPEVLHCINLVALFLDQHHEEPYTKYLRKRIQSLLREMQQKVQIARNSLT